MKYTVILTGLTLLGCGLKKEGNSTLNGHFEQQTPDVLQEVKGRAMPLAEYATSEGIVLSYHMVRRNPDKLPFVSHLLSKGKVWFLLPKGESGHNNYILRDLHDYLEENFTESELKIRKDNIYTFNSTEEDKDQAFSWAKGIWARDWAPISASIKGKLGFYDFNYYSSRAYEDGAVAGYTQRRNRWWKNRELPLPFKRVSLPIYNEGGNFMADDKGHCALAEGPLLENLKSKNPEDIKLSISEIKSYLVNYLGCRKVTVFPTLPHEKTGHIDLWGKFVGNNTVLVAAFESWQRKLVCGNSILKSALVAERADEKCIERQGHFDEIKAYLDARAQDFSDMGYRVVKTVVPLPAYEERERGDKFVFRSYVNSLSYLDVNGEQHIYFPQFKRPPEGVTVWKGSSEYVDAAQTKQYEQKLFQTIADANKKYGLDLKPMFVPSDDLIFQGGAVHCVTMQVPTENAASMQNLGSVN